MMNREAKVMASVQKAVSEGYEFLGKGMGTQDEALASKRSEGYDVRAWYTQMKGEKSTWQWIMYGRMKGQRRVSQPKAIDFSSLNTKDLKKMCSEKKISGYSKMNKAQMIESLSQAC